MKTCLMKSLRCKHCHAGLECGILNERYPGLDMISFGPTIKNPHSPDEKGTFTPWKSSGIFC